MMTDTNPYLAARKVWTERYGFLIDSTRNWRLLALISCASALVSVALAGYATLRNPFQPFPVLIDHLGRAVSGSYAGTLSYEDIDRVKRATIREFVTEMRSVTTDGVAQRRWIDSVYARLGRGTPAQAMLNEHYRNDPPHERARSVTVAVQVHSVLPTTDKTFEVDWTETVRGLQGDLKSQDRMRASLTIAIAPACRAPAARTRYRSSVVGLRRPSSRFASQ